MATFTVTTAADDGAGSLRAAVSAANALAGADVVAFDAAVFDGGSEDLIRLTSGQIEILDGLTITGGPSGVTITGDAGGDDVTLAGGITDVDASLDGEDRLDDNSRIFNATVALTLDGLTLTGGRTMAEFESGGAVRGRTVTLIDSTVSGNSTAGHGFAGGGGVLGVYGVTLTNSTVSGNSTAGYNSVGGGILSFGDVTLTNSTVSGNSTVGHSSGSGGVSGGNVALTNSTVSGNSTAGEDSDGGGVGGDDVTLTNSTVSGNSTAGDGSAGGGINGSNVMLINSTVSGNSTAGEGSDGGGVRAYGDVALSNSLVLGNTTIFAGVDADEVEGAVTRTGGNIVGGDLFNGDADVGDVSANEVFAATTEIAPGVLAGVLGDNGGPTLTILIAADGPAVDAGGATALPIDQRGLERVFGAAVDLGAVELGARPVEPGSLLVTTALDIVANDGLTSLREAVLFANLERGADTISFDASAFDGEVGDVIRLTNGQIAITGALILDGGAAGVTITGDAAGDDVTRVGGITDVAASLNGEDRLDDNSRIFDAVAQLTIDGLTLTGGRTTADFEGGGAVRGTAALTLIDSTVTGNSTAGDYAHGGGVLGSGASVTVTNSTISGNSAAGYFAHGGGINGYGILTVSNSTVSDNATAGNTGRGGGLSAPTVDLADSTVTGNSTAGYDANGGGINGDRVDVTNSIVSDNSTAGSRAAGGGISGYSHANVTGLPPGKWSSLK